MDYAGLIAEVSTQLGTDSGFPMRATEMTALAETDLSRHFLEPEYEALDGLAANDTNWLLASDPDIYRAALLKQHYLFKLDTEKALQANSLLDALCDDKKLTDRTNTWRGKGIQSGGYVI